MTETKPCPECTGSGTCPTCEGDGEVEDLCVCPECQDEHESLADCAACDGDGQCVRCQGSGRVPVTDQDREQQGQLTFEGVAA